MRILLFLLVPRARARFHLLGQESERMYIRCLMYFYLFYADK